MDGTLYFECYSGISGDMAVAAMLDLGADRGRLMDVLESLPLDGYRVEVSKVRRSGLDVCDFNVILEEDNHDHDMEYLYGSDARHQHRGHGKGLGEIFGIIDAGRMTDRARELAKRIFAILGEAEAEAHGVPLEKVHFHEVGAVDSIVDIVSLAVCLDDLDPDGVCFSPLYEGAGTVRCQHGVLPVPVPAVANIVSKHGLRLTVCGSEGEFVTPTGAAFAAAVSDRAPPREFSILGVGMGAGKRVTDRPSIVRAMLVDAGGAESVCRLECNIDDCSGEALGYTMERLFSEGAKDVHYSPVFMKKNRPAYQLTVICSDDDAGRMEDVIFRETTTIGIRRCRVERTVLDREVREEDTPLGIVRVKVCRHDGAEVSYPEYDSLAAICREKDIPYREAYDTVMRFCNRPRAGRPWHQ